MDILPPSLAWLVPEPTYGSSVSPVPATPAAEPDPAPWFHGADGGVRIGLSAIAHGPTDVAGLAQQVLAHLLA